MNSRTTLLLVVSALAAGCASGRRPGTTAFTENYRLPVYTLVSGPEAQTRGSVTVQVVAPTFTASVEPYTWCEQTRYFAYDAFTPGGRQYDIMSSQRVVVSPQEPVFELRFTNGLSNVLKLDGAVLTATVDGVEKKLSLFDEWERANQLDTTAARRTILPGHAATYRVRVPALDPAGKPSTLAFALYDVVTAVDAAGTPTARSVFQWSFKGAAEARTQAATLTIEQRKLTREDEARCSADEQATIRQAGYQAGPAPGAPAAATTRAKAKRDPF